MTKARIGLLSKLMRMTPEAIRFYEKKKIITPERKADSNYREYSMTDIKKLYDCKNLRNVNFSLKEVDFIMDQASLAENQAALAAKKEELQRSIQEQMMMLNKLDRSLMATTMYERYQHKHERIEAVDYAFYAYSRNEKLNDAIVQSPVYEQVMDYHNLFSCSAFFDLTDQQQLAEFGFSISTELALQNEINIEPPVRQVKGAQALYTVIKTSAIIRKEDILPITHWAEEHNYPHQNCVLARLISSFYDHGQEERYYELYVPIAQS